MLKDKLPLVLFLLLPIAAAGASAAAGCTSGLSLPSTGRSGAGGNPTAISPSTTGGSMGGLGGAGLGGGSGGGGMDASVGTSGSGGGGGGGATSVTSLGGAGGTAPGTTTTATTSPATSGATACAIGHVVISQIRSRGAGGASDEFVELFNATGAALTLDDGWTIEARGTSDATYRAHWTGSGKSVAAWGHYLVAGTAYAETPAADAALSSGLVDAASVRLVQGGQVLDAVCYGFDAATLGAFDATFTCAGTPVSNLPHDNTASAGSDTDTSLVRRPGGTLGNCTDTGDNASDFVAESPAEPEATTSPPTP